jgi:cell division septum initiation protein DivIVA
VTSDDSTGLNLFDETASAVGNFPFALRGYDRAAVDDYVRTLEGRVVRSNQQIADLQRQLNDLHDQLGRTSKELEERPSGEIDYASLGARASSILRMAEEQARELLDKASADANKLREDGQRDADRLRQQAGADSEHVRVSGRAELEQLRARAESDVAAEVERARTEASAIRAAAEREAEALRRKAAQEADAVRTAGDLEADERKRAAESEAAALRQQIAKERQDATAELKRVHQESVAATGKLLSEATQHHQQAGERLAADIESATKLRTEAQAEAEKVKLDAKEEAERVLAAAKKQAERITQRTQQEFAWRKEQLKRETENLMQRKQAVLNQLQSLSALASQSAAEVPEMRPLADLSDDLEAFTEEATAGEDSETSAVAENPEAHNPEENEDTANLGDPTAADADTPRQNPTPAAKPATKPPTNAPTKPAEADQPTIARPVQAPRKS